MQKENKQRNCTNFYGEVSCEEAENWCINKVTVEPQMVCELKKNWTKM